MINRDAFEVKTAENSENTRNVQTETIPGSFRDRAEQAIATGGRAAQQSARSLAWQIVAEKIGGPLPVESSVSEYGAANVRKVIRAHGGAVAVARRIRAGEASRIEADALFRPFGDIDEAGRQAALNLITSHPAYGDDLWDASVLAATRMVERKH